MGSVPEPRCNGRRNCPAGLDRERPLLALHVGNSRPTGFYTALRSSIIRIGRRLTIRHPASHRHPQRHAIALLGQFGLLSNSIIIPATARTELGHAR
jgi:hypothetical protein